MYARGVLGLTPLCAWNSTKTLLPAQRVLIVFAYICLLICRLNANTTEWMCMQISRNIVNGPKRNNYVLLGIWIIVCIQKPSPHFLHTFRPLRMFKIVFRDRPLYPNHLSIFCLLWLISANFAKTLVWITWIWRHKQRTPNTNDTIRHWMKHPSWNFSAYPTDPQNRVIQKHTLSSTLVLYILYSKMIKQLQWKASQDTCNLCSLKNLLYWLLQEARFLPRRTVNSIG